MNVLITGAASGLGSELAVKLGQVGHSVVALDIDTTSLDTLQVKTKDSIRLLLCDVSNEQEVKKAAERLGDEPLDVIVNNAAIGYYEEVMLMDPARWQQQIAVNLTGPFLVTRYFGSKIIARKGKIINIGSRRAMMPNARYGGYCATKFGLRGFSLCLAEELASKGVEVSVIELCAMLTDFGKRLAERKQQREKGECVLDPVHVASYVVDIIEGKIEYKPEYLLDSGADGEVSLVNNF